LIKNEKNTIEILIFKLRKFVFNKKIYLIFFLLLIIYIMGGGLMQLVAYGAQDVYLSGNPQITL